MQRELNYFSPQLGGYHQNEQQLWDPCSNTNDFPSDTSLEELFGESSVAYSGESTSNLMSSDFLSSLVDAESNNMMDPFSYHQNYKSIATQQDRCSGSSPDDFFSTSDTDSGIHSPGATKSPPGDAIRWGTNAENKTFESYFQHPSHCHGPVTNEAIRRSNPPFNGQETQLLNLDDQRSYTAVPLRSIHSSDSPLSLGNQEYKGYGETIKVEYSPLHETWPMTFCSNESTSGNLQTSGNFQTSGSFQIPTSSQSSFSDVTTQRKLKKTLKRRARSKKSRKAEKGKSSPHLWEFIRDIVLNPKYNPSLIKWEDKDTGVFRFVQSDKVATMWGKEKQNTKMTYEKLSRAMRYYYNRGILERVDGRRLVYKFGPTSHGWKNCPKTSIKSENTVSESASTDSTSVDSKASDSTLKLVEILDANLLLHPNSNETSSASLPSANVLLGKNLRFATA